MLSKIKSFICVFFLVFILFSPGAVHSELVIIDSFPTPDSVTPHGLTFDGTNLWCAGYSNDTIYKLDMSGNTILSFNSPGQSPTGLTFDGTHLWSTDDVTLQIYKLDPATGGVIESFNAPGTDSTGLTFDGTHLWNADFSWSDPFGLIHKMDRSGNLVGTYYSPGDGPEGLTFDGFFIWHSDFYNNKIYQLTMDGNVLSSTDSHVINPIGLAFDGQYLWVASFSENRIYKLAIIPTPSIKANGMDGPIQIGSGNPLSIHIALASGSFTGHAADWWCLADTPVGWYSYRPATGTWSPGLQVTLNRPLLNLPVTKILMHSGLPNGNYRFYFGIDDLMNSIIDGNVFYDQVVVTVGP